MSARAIIGIVAGIVGLTAWASPGHAQQCGVAFTGQSGGKYFALDNKGVRLDASSFESVAGYVDWKEEPAWGKLSSSMASRCRMISANKS